MMFLLTNEYTFLINSETSLKQPPWRQRKIAVLESWQLWECKGVHVYDICSIRGTTFISLRYASLKVSP